MLLLFTPNSLWPHELQHTRFLCPSLSPRDCSNLCPLSQWCHPTCSLFVTPFSSCPQSFLASGSFPMSRFFASGGRSIGASASASVLPMNVQCWFPLGWTGLISLLSKGLSRIFSNTMVWTHQFFSAQPCLWSNSHICTWLLKNQNFDYMGFVCKVMSLVFNIMSRSVIAFLPKGKLFHGYSHHPQWLWNSKEENLALIPLFTHLFAMKWWDWMLWS